MSISCHLLSHSCTYAQVNGLLSSLFNQLPCRLRKLCLVIVEIVGDMRCLQIIVPTDVSLLLAISSLLLSHDCRTSACTIVLQIIVRNMEIWPLKSETVL
jgi:hypothetical protein